MYHRTSSRGRAGFTLVEALVVVAILAILFGMTTAAVMQALTKAEDARVLIEIKQLEAAIAAWKSEYSASFLPSTMALRKNLYFDTTDRLQARSKEVLSQLYPRMQFPSTNDSTIRINWTTSGNAQTLLQLDPAECFVFFLGGRFNGIGLDGWSKHPTDPWNGAGTRVKPFFEFSPERIKVRPGREFPVFLDPYREKGSNQAQPYIYFTSYKSGNDYSDLDYYQFGYQIGTQTYRDRVRPFVDPNSASTGSLRFYNPNSFQIVSAGRDGLFGEFTFTSPPQTPQIDWFVKWRNGTYSTGWNTTGAIRRNAPMDNFSNFHPTKLGIPQ
jgi:prepilin-type N-terminal cleavage/methylation domain-containing protein